MDDERINRILIIVVIAIELIIIGLLIFINYKREEKIVSDNESTEISADVLELEKDSNNFDEIALTESKEEIFYKVDIKGAVNNPGVYEVKDDSRVIDVVRIAGGFKDNANTNYLNLAKKVTDEMIIIVNTNDEIVKMNKKPIITIDKEKEEKKEEPKKNNKININTANKEELMSLSGIGETKANDIILYRKTNKFNKLEDIKNVKGIGESLYNKIKEFITI